MLRQFSKLLLVLFFSVLAISVAISEEKKKITSLDEAKTTADILDYVLKIDAQLKKELEEEFAHLQKEKKETVDVYVKFLRNKGEISLASGEKILEISNEINE